MCSSSNDDRSNECFVCGQPRSEESIREARRRAKHEKKKKIIGRVFICMSMTAKIMFFSAISVFTLIASTMLVALMIKGDLSLVIENGIIIGKHFGNGVVETIGENVILVIYRVYDYSLMNFANNLELTSNSIASIPGFFSGIIYTAKNRCVPSLRQLGDVLTGLLSTSTNSLETAFSILTLLVQDVREQLNNMSEKVLMLFNKAAEKKNIFIK